MKENVGKLASLQLLSPKVVWHQFSTHFRHEGNEGKETEGRQAGQEAELFPSHSQAPGSHPGDPTGWGGGAAPSLVGTMLVRVTSSGSQPPFSFWLIVLCMSKDHSYGDSA